MQIKLGEPFVDMILTLIKTPTVLETRLSENILNGKLAKDQVRLLDEITENECFSNLPNHIQNKSDLWLDFYKDNIPEDIMPTGWDNTEFDNTFVNQQKDKEKSRKVLELLKRCIIMRTLRADRFSVVCNLLIEEVLGHYSKNYIKLYKFLNFH